MQLDDSPIGAKDVIKECIIAYKLVHKAEYDAFLKMNSQQIVLQNKHGLMTDTKALGEWRKLSEIPVTLYNIIKSMTNDQQWKWFNTKNGKMWLVTTYKEFLGREKL